MKVEETQELVHSQWSYLLENREEGLATIVVPETEATRMGVDDNLELHVLSRMDEAEDERDEVTVAPGLRVSIQVHEFEGVAATYFQITCEGERKYLFSPFVADYLIELEDSNPEDAFSETFKKWKKFWSGVRPPLSPHEQRGLFGELWAFLRLSEYQTPDELVKYWTGPLEALHDYQSGTLDIEVKTTIRDPPVVRITDIEQVAPMVSKRLILNVFSLNFSDSGASLPELVDKVLGLPMNAEASSEVVEKLSKVGYLTEDRLHYPQKYEVSSELFCPIDVDSPILDPLILADIPNTVSHLRYSLHINGLSRYSPLAEDWEEAAESLVSGDPSVLLLQSVEVLDASEIASMDESQTLEFKSSIWHAYGDNVTPESASHMRKTLQNVIVKSVAGLLNKEGGTLLIGISDDKQILGVEPDMKERGIDNLDALENTVMSFLSDSLKRSIVAEHVRISFPELAEHVLCRLDMTPSTNPVFTLINNSEAFFVRIGNSTKPMSVSEAVAYVNNHWK